MMGEQETWASAIETGDLAMLGRCMGCALSERAYDSRGKRPAWLCARHGRAECLELLARSGAALDEADIYGETPLMVAAGSGHAGCLRILIGAGCSLSARDRNPEFGRDAAMLAARDGHAECFRMLLEAGCPRQFDADGFDALWHAASCGKLECVELALAAGFDARRSNSNGETALWAASDAGCIDALLDAGADPGRLDKSGRSAAMGVAMRGRLDGLRALARRGADFSHRDARGQTAADYARRYGHQTCAAFLDSRAEQRELEGVSQGREKATAQSLRI